MAINIEHTYETCAHVHYFPGDFVINYDLQTLNNLAEMITEAIIKHNFEQALAYDIHGCSLMVVTRT